MGKLKEPKLRGKYDTGQLFLHRIFGYRGVVLFPWSARVYDRDLPNNAVAEVEKNDDGTTNVSPEGKTNTFYQVLIDSRDCPYIVSKTLPPAHLSVCNEIRRSNRERKPKRWLFWVIKIRIEVFTPYPDWTMCRTRIFCHIRPVKRHHCIMNYSINFSVIRPNEIHHLRHRKHFEHGKRKIIHGLNCLMFIERPVKAYE